MKRILFTTLFAACIATGYSQKDKSEHSYMINTDSGKSQHTIRINDGREFLEIKFNGEISFNDEETAIKSLSPNSSFSYNKDGKKIIITSDNDGNLSYEVNGTKKTILDKDETTFLATAIQTMIENGVGAKDRVERIYKKSGSRAVLNEVVKMKSDYIQSMYLGYLLATNSLSVNEMTEIADNIKQLISSDYEKGKLLSKFSEKYLENAATAQAYLAAVKSISSDYEKAKAIKIILKQKLTSAQFTEVLQVINSIGSDYEKSNVLKAVLNNNQVSGQQFSEVLKATSMISSDYEKANVVRSILKNNKLHESEFNEALEVVTSIGSSYEQSNMLKQLVNAGVGSESQWISLINATEKLSSDYDKSNVLQNIAAKMPQTENVKTAYSKAAKTISSDYEYGKALRAMK
jgi:hypothetical protein